MGCLKLLYRPELTLKKNDKELLEKPKTVIVRYRYSFNGKESESDIAEGDYDYGARMYDSRLGRWMSRDPLEAKYPAFSVYSAFNNNPIAFVDKTGKSAELSVSGGRLIITANLNFYTAIGRFTEEDAKNIASNIQTIMQAEANEYLAKNGKVDSEGKRYLEVNGEKVYSVDVFISGKVISTAEANEKMKTNTSAAENYIEIHDGTKASLMKGAGLSSGPDNTEYTMIGSNVGSWNINDLLDEKGGKIGAILPPDVAKQFGSPTSNRSNVSKTPLHEFLHGLGLLSSVDGGDATGHAPNSGELQPPATSSKIYAPSDFLRNPSDQEMKVLFDKIQKATYTNGKASLGDVKTGKP